MFCYLLWGVGITLSLSAVAKKSPAPILIRAPNTPVKEFLAYAETEPVQTYLQHQIDHNKKKPRPVNLRSLLKQAQMDFLSHEPKSSKKSWQAIADHIHSFDWNKEERKIIFYSLLRLAQLEKDSRKKDLLLKEALTFSMGLKPDTQIFPPPLTNRYAQLKKSATFVPLNLKAVFPQHSAILINGRVYSHHEKPILPEGFYKVSALSTSHEKWTKTLSLSRLLSKKVKTPPLTKGSCQKPILENKHLQTKNLLILFPNFCVWDSSLKLAQEQKQILNLNKPPALNDSEETENESHYEEWLWLGVAVVIGATTIYALSRGEPKEKPKPQKKEPKPIVKIGF